MVQQQSEIKASNKKKCERAKIFGRGEYENGIIYVILNGKQHQFTRFAWEKNFGGGGGMHDFLLNW